MWAWSCWPRWRDFLLVRDCKRVPHCREVRSWLLLLLVVVYVDRESRIVILLRWVVVGYFLRKLGESIAFMKGRLEGWVVE